MMPGMYANDAWMRSFLAAAKSCDSTRWEGAPNVRNAFASRRMNFFRLSEAGEYHINRRKERGRGGERGGERRDGGWRVVTVTHEHGYSQTETVSALASMAQWGPFLSRQTPPSSTAFGHRSKVWTLGA